MDKQQLDAIKARCKAAMPGPWYFDGRAYTPDGLYAGAVRSSAESHPDFIVAEVRCAEYASCASADSTEFIAHARDDVPALVAEVEKLQSRVFRYEEALRRYANPHNWYSEERDPNWQWVADDPEDDRPWDLAYTVIHESEEQNG